jgi:Cd2+/Zn2+-exporting ATPase
MKYKLIMNGLDCANCAAKIEKAIANTEGFEEVSLVFATKSLYFEHIEDENIIEKVQKITDGVEDGVEVSFEEKHTHNHKHCHDGHCHKAKKSPKLSTILLFSAIAFAVAALILEIFKVNEISVAILSAAAIIMSGYKVFISGVKSVFKLQIDETTLMTIAVIAAFCLGEFVEGAMVTILFGVGEMLEDKAVEKSRKSIEKLANIRSDEAVILENGIEKTVNAEEVEIGTEIIIKPYAKVPLDCVVTDGKSSVDASAITGESMPFSAEKGSELLSGMVNGETLIKAKTTKLLEDSTASRIIKLVEEASTTKSKNEKLITRFASVYTPIVIFIALAVAFIPPIFFGDITAWIYRGLVCLVASCPCAIVISVPLSYYSGIGAASKYGALFKGGKYLEILSAADTIAFDKTGTLTEGELTIEDIIPYKNYNKDEVLTLAASVEKNSTHPIARAIKRSAKGEYINMSSYEEKSGGGVSALYNGRTIKCVGYRNLKNKPEDIADAYLIYDDEIIAAFKLKDKIRNEAPSITQKLKSLGFKKLVMLTGDSKTNADKIKNDLPALDESYASLLPAEKLEIVNVLKENNKGVCFVGDGINDAPVITASDCGFAMGLGSDAAIASADVVLTAGNLSALPKIVKLAKKTVTTAKTNIAFALIIKALVIILASLGMAQIWMGVAADTGVCLLCVLWATRILKMKV